MTIRIHTLNIWLKILILSKNPTIPTVNLRQTTINRCQMLTTKLTNSTTIISNIMSRIRIRPTITIKQVKTTHMVKIIKMIAKKMLDLNTIWKVVKSNNTERNILSSKARP